MFNENEFRFKSVYVLEYSIWFHGNCKQISISPMAITKEIRSIFIDNGMTGFKMNVIHRQFAITIPKMTVCQIARSISKK